VPGPAGQRPGLRIRSQRVAVGGGVRADRCFPSGFSFLFEMNFEEESARARQVKCQTFRPVSSTAKTQRREEIHCSTMLQSFLPNTSQEELSRS
jgi:hypothetical protein